MSVGLRKAVGLEKDTIAPGASAVDRIVQDGKGEALRGIPPHIIKKSWFTLAHTLLEKGAHVIDAGCSDGIMAYTMAALKPDIKVTGIDIDPATIAAEPEKIRPAQPDL